MDRKLWTFDLIHDAVAEDEDEDEDAKEIEEDEKEDEEVVLFPLAA